MQSGEVQTGGLDLDRLQTPIPQSLSVPVLGLGLVDCADEV